MPGNISINKGGFARSLHFVTNNYRSQLSVNDNSSVLAFFRIAIVLLALIHWLVLFRYAPLLYGEYGIIRPEIARAIRQVTGNRFINVDLHTFTAQISTVFHVTEQTAIDWYLAIYAFFLLLLGAGFLTPLSALITWLLYIVLLNSYQLTSYGYDMFMSNALLLMVFMPVNQRLSMDGRLFANSRFFKMGDNPRLTNFSLAILKFFLCLIYFFSGINKMASIQWWNGEAIWRAAMQPPFRTFDLGFLAKWPILLAIGAIFTLLAETSYIVLVNLRQTKKYIISCIILMHLTIALLLSLWFFAAIMIIFNLTVFLTNTESAQKPRFRIA